MQSEQDDRARRTWIIAGILLALWVLGHFVKDPTPQMSAAEREELEKQAKLERLARSLANHPR